MSLEFSPSRDAAAGDPDRHDPGQTLLSEWADRQQLADELGVSVATIIRLDARREGPPRQRLGNRILYHRPSVADWLRQRAEKQTRT